MPVAMTIILKLVPLVRLGCVVLAFTSGISRKDCRAHVKIQIHFAFKVNRKALVRARREAQRTPARSSHALDGSIYCRSINRCAVSLCSETLHVKGRTSGSALLTRTLHWHG